MSASFGNVNRDRFDLGSETGKVFYSIPVQCGLYMGAQFSPLQFFPDGTPYRNYEMTYTVRPRPWNNIWRKTARVFQLVALSGRPNLPNVQGNYPYFPDDLTKIFTP